MTKGFLQSILGAVLIVATSGVASAQDRDRDRDHDAGFYQSRDQFYHGEHWRARLFERVRQDVDRVQSSTFPVSKDEFRLVKTKEELSRLQDKLTAGRYDEPELNDVVTSLQRVVDSNKLSPRDREMLSDDLNHLREYKEHHENWDRR